MTTATASRVNRSGILSAHDALWGVQAVTIRVGYAGVHIATYADEHRQPARARKGIARLTDQLGDGDNHG